MNKVLLEQGADFIFSSFKETKTEVSWEWFLGKTDSKRSEDEYFVTSMLVNSILDLYQEPILDNEYCKLKFNNSLSKRR